MSISAYSSTPASNTAISGINIAEGCNASNINDAIRQVMADIASAFTLTTANSFDDKYAASGMPANMSLGSIPAAGHLFNVTVSFLGTVNNTNATPFSPKITVAVKDGSTVLASREWNTAGSAFPTGFNDRVTFTLTFEVVYPAAGAFTIVITDSEADGASHAWTNAVVAGSATVIR